jgi:SNF2 family DNA or RNA helicase
VRGENVTLPLKDYQRENVKWIQEVGRGLLADEPGLGKSRSALEGFAGAEKVLIIAPTLVVESGVWHDEVELWGSDDTKYHLATYAMLNVRKDVRSKKEKEQGRPHRHKPVNLLRPEWRGHWDAVIIDEAHYIKGRDTHWTWAVDKVAKNADSLILLTGTPIPNWAHEVFTLLRTIYPDQAHPGKDLGSFWRWAEQWFDTEPNPYDPRGKLLRGMSACVPACERRNVDDPCEHYEAFARANFGDRYMRHLRADHLDLPPIEFIDINTPLDRETREAYRSLKKDFAAEVEGHEMLAWSLGAKNVMLDRMTTSPWMLHKEGEPRGGKLERLRADLSARTRPTLVFAHYRDSVEAAARVAMATGARAAYIHGGTTDRQNARVIKDFKSGALDVLVGSLETLAEGLTLTIADEAIFLERSYKPSRNTQATYRIYRLGQDKPVKIRRYLTPNSIDSRKEKLLQTKTDHQVRTLTAADFLRLA